MILEADGYIVVTLQCSTNALVLIHMKHIIKQRMNEKRAVKIDNTYKWACNKLSKEGPDVTCLGITDRKAVAIPSILSGCETLEITKRTIIDL